MSKKTCLILMLLISMSMLFLGIKIGSVQISLTDLLQILVKKTVSEDGILEGIIWNVRLPRVVMAYLVGAGLAVSGTVMQSLLGNPLASSYTLGVSAGASLGAALIMVTGVTASILGAFLLGAASTAGEARASRSAAQQVESFIISSLREDNFFKHSI